MGVTEGDSENRAPSMCAALRKGKSPGAGGQRRALQGQRTIERLGAVHSPPSGLKRELGVGALAALVVGEVVAVGIFLTPAGMAHSLGSPLWLLLVWLLMGGMALTGALCYGELAARLPEAGGGYVYLRSAFGRGIALLYGWKCLLVMDPGITAALAVGLGSYVGYLTSIGAGGQKLVAVGAILVAAAINVAGVPLGARTMQWLTAFKIGAHVPPCARHRCPRRDRDLHPNERRLLVSRAP